MVRGSPKTIFPSPSQDAFESLAQSHLNISRQYQSYPLKFNLQANVTFYSSQLYNWQKGENGKALTHQDLKVLYSGKHQQQQ